MDNNSSAVANGTDGTHGSLDGSNLVTLWVGFLLVMLLAAAFDACYISKKKAMKGSTSCPSYVKQIIFWIICAFGFSFMVVILIGWPAAGSWTYGYFLEYMLSVDNLFVFQLVFKSYATPDSHVERALFWGILAAILLRLVFFGVGTTILAMGFFSKLVFGLLLIYSGFKAGAFWSFVVPLLKASEFPKTKSSETGTVARIVICHEFWHVRTRLAVLRHFGSLTTMKTIPARTSWCGVLQNFCLCTTNI